MYKRLFVIFISVFWLSACSSTRPYLGLAESELSPCPDTPNCVNSQINSNEEDQITPITYLGTLVEAHARTVEKLESEKRAKIRTIDSNYIHVEFTSAFFHFVDDVEFYFVELHSGKTVIHVRSASRIGYSDFGVNRKRIERIRSEFYQ